MYSIGIAATLLGVCVKTLRRWDKSKRIVCYRTTSSITSKLSLHPNASDRTLRNKSYKEITNLLVND